MKRIIQSIVNYLKSLLECSHKYERVWNPYVGQENSRPLTGSRCVKYLKLMWD